MNRRLIRRTTAWLLPWMRTAGQGRHRPTEVLPAGHRHGGRCAGIGAGCMALPLGSARVNVRIMFLSCAAVSHKVFADRGPDACGNVCKILTLTEATSSDCK